MKTLSVGIASYKEMKARTMAITRGEHKVTRAEPKLWFPSIESARRILSRKKPELLHLILRSQRD